MGINRRTNRRTFKFNKNYIIPLVCIFITCMTVIISTCIILDLQRQVPIYANEHIGEQISKIEPVKLQDNQILQINNLFSFLMSNLDIGQDIDEAEVRHKLACKYYAQSYSLNVMPEPCVDSILVDIYRELGYVYFEDYKDTYMYISKSDYIDVYKKMFDFETLNGISQYYISSLDGYVVPKNNYTYDNSRYKLSNISYNNEEDIYIATLLEVNMLKLYEEKEYTQVEEYLGKSLIDNNYLTGKMFKVRLKNVDNCFVFQGYTI